MEDIVVCKSCGLAGSGYYCFNCGQSLNVKRISIKSLLHEVAHFFTHMDKGIRYTLKELIVHPGKMQFSYIEGKRINHQKPFSMYFVSATVLGLILYWINLLLLTYFHAGDASEASFFHQYMVAFLLLVIPFSALITYAFFYNSGFNFSEIGVFQLYTLSVFFLIVILCNLLKLIWTDFETRYLELPLVLIYNAITFANFFPGPKWKIVIKSVLCATIFFLSITFVQDYLVKISAVNN
jgi:hypothetical protein